VFSYGAPRDSGESPGVGVMDGGPSLALLGRVGL